MRRTARTHVVRDSLERRDCASGGGHSIPFERAEGNRLFERVSEYGDRQLRAQERPGSESDYTHGRLQRAYRDFMIERIWGYSDVRRYSQE